jgi:LPLT family lysophospholipid transporter-like MFS transporter
MKPSRNYPLLLLSQFLSAFGDNAILAVIVGQLTVMKKQGLISDQLLRERSALYTLLLFIPYVLLAPRAGYLNDRYAKTTWLLGGNLIKLAGTVVCGLSIWLGYIWQAPGYIIVGIGSCFYGPAKYGILPEILPRERLVKANGTVELLTLLAIITGAVAGAFMADRLPLTACYAILLGIFGASLALNVFMTRTAANPATDLKRSVGEFFSHTRDLLVAPRLGKVLIGTALFWVCGAAMKINFQAWGLGVLQLPTNLQVSLLGLWLSVGVMAGSMLAGQLHAVGDLRRTRKYGFALAGALLLLWTVEPLPFWRHWVVQAGEMRLLPAVIVLLVVTGFIAGLFLIPLNAALQAESDPAKMGKTIAVQNLCDNVGMLLAGGMVLACTKAGLSTGQVFAAIGTLVIGVVLWLRIPRLEPVKGC